MAKHHIERSSQDVGPINSAPHGVRPKARELKGRERLNALHECCRACRVRVGIANRTCLEEGWVDTLLCLLRNAERCDSQGYIPNRENARVSELIWQRARILDI